MFDNLKEKLGSFRSDAEEAAEENVEELDEEVPDEEVPDEELPDEAPEEETRDEAAGEETRDEAAGEERAGGEPADPELRDGDPEPRDGEAGADRSGAATPATGARTDSGAGSTVDASTDVEAPADEGDVDESVDESAEEGDVDSGEASGGGATGFGRKAKSFVRGKFVIEEEDLEAPLQELELALLSSDVEMGVAEEITDRIEDELVGETRTFTTSTGEVVEEALEEALLDVIGVGQFDFDERIAIEDRPVVIVFTGVNGVGKTTTIAKLHRYLAERGYSTVLANGDTYRAGANEQIREHAENLDAKLIAHEQGGDPAAVLYDAVEYAEANDVDVVLGDTAGRLHTNEDLMAQLEKIDRVVDPDLTLFVDEAVAGQDAVNRAREFDDAAEIDGAVLTKADADSDGGAAISIAHVTGKPILFLGVGQGYDDIVRFDPEDLVAQLVEE